MSAAVRPLRLSWPAEHARSSDLRARLRRWLDGQDVGPPAYDDVLLVASELFANAVRATAGPEPVDVVVRAAPGNVVVEVTNTGPGFDPDAVPPPEHGRAGGRGIAIARAVGALGVVQHGRCTTVTVAIAVTVSGRGLPGG